MDCKKTQKKVKRFLYRLKNPEIIKCTGIPSKNIVLCNAGQATGLQKCVIHSIIRDMFPDMVLPKYIPLNGESFSFLIFNNLSNAEIFLKTCNGIIKHNKDPLFMTFVESVPTSETICTHEDPKGLTILQDFLTNEEEKILLNMFNFIDSNLKNRQVKHYGYEFRYGTNDVDLTSPLNENIPEQCKFIWQKLRLYKTKIDSEPDQLTVNKYIPGQGIPLHVDTHSPFKDTILSLSLGSPIVMDWKHHSGKYVPIHVPSRSLLLMTGEARYDWQHGIQSRTWDPILQTQMKNIDGETKSVKIITNETVDRGTRISLTFRWTQSGPCQCSYKTFCDSVISTSTEDLENKLASNLEDIHVHQVYEKIADHFSTTRHKPWPKVVEFMSEVRTGSIVLDLGCGNGKNILNRNDILQIAGERSSGLLSECKNYTKDLPCVDCVRLDLLNGSIKDSCADIIICIAVIHHFSSKSRRMQAISTITRLLVPGGRALVTVWAKDQTNSNYLCKNKQIDQTENTIFTVGGINLPIHENRTQFQHNDLLVPWKLRKVKNKQLSDKPESTLLRYYHVFQEGELDELCQSFPDLVIENSFYEEGNWCVVVCKKM